MTNTQRTEYRSLVGASTNPVRTCAIVLAAATGAAALVGPAPVWAAEDAEDARRLPNVVVTATRSARDAFDVPAAIDAVAIDSLGHDGLGVHLSEVLAQIPGVLARNRNSHAQDEQIAIRGFGARSTFGVRGVRLYTDGIPASMPDGSGQVSHFNLGSAARVEVLRGPFSALYGNSSGGVIQIFTADGEGPPQLRAGLAGGSNGIGRAGINLRGGGERIGYNVDLSHFRTDGWRAHSAAERHAFNSKVSWNVGGSATLTLIGNAVSVPEAQDPLGLTLAQFREDPRQVAAVAAQFNTRKSVAQAQAGAIWEQALGPHTSLRILAYSGNRAVEQYLAIPMAAQNSPLHSGGVIDLDSDYHGTDARWTWNRGAFELTLGANYENQQQKRLGYLNHVGDVLGVRGTRRRDEDNRAYNIDQYAQASWRFAANASLLAGVRHSTIRFRSHDRYITAANPDDSGSRRYSATTPVLGVLVDVSPSTGLYATWGKGFETPTFAELAYRSDAGSGLNFGLEPARSRNAELGAKLRVGEAVESALAVFRASTDDELAIATNAGGRTTFQNIGNARREGVEASLSARLGGRWNLQLAGTWLDATFRSPFLTCTGSPCTTPATPVAAGTRIPGVPRSQLRVALTHGGEYGWRTSVQVERMSAVPVNDIGSESAPAYAIAGIDVGYGFRLSSGTLRAFASIDNLFDRAHVGSVIVNEGNGRFHEPGIGRSVLVGAQWHWGGR